ncbi:MAG: hypothetical protein J1F38_04825 [Muribaculaceae bacterium]|nr:hypothetical protein [Muribaculaceae bacterium]
MSKHFLIHFLLLAIIAIPMSAEEKKESKFKLTPSGRILIDGAVYASPDKYLFRDGMAIPEARLGVKMGYGKWSSWIDVGFAYGKIGLRNMWIQYDFNEHNNLRVGNYLQPFGYQGPTTGNNKATFEQPLASALFTPGLQLGMLYTFQNPSMYSATGFHVESNALTNVTNYPLFNQQGFTFLTRFVYRNKFAGQNGKPILHGGISLSFSTPDTHLVDNEDIHEGFTNSATFPTKVSTMTAISAVVGSSRNRFKLSPELLLGYKRFALESQYFFQTISRKYGLTSFNAHGAYVTLRTMILGGDYSYDASIAHLSHPKKNALEFVADYNYATLSDHKAKIFGGRANSFNFTLNYYFNAYITARLNYAYTYVWDREDVLPLTQNAIQLRLMVLF